jgi:dUTPase
MNLKIVKMFDDVITPKKANKTDSGFDVYAYSFKIHYWGDDDTEYKSEYPKQVYPSSITLDKNDRVLIGTGIKLTYGEGYEIQVRPRSGLALNKGLTVLNTPAQSTSHIEMSWV